MRSFVQSAVVCSMMACVLVGVAILLPQTPVSASSKATQRGAELFAERGCAHCHGTDGIGGKHGPDLQLVRKRMNKAQMRLQIHDGGMTMPAYGSTLTSPQIEDLIAYLRTKRKVIVASPQPHTDAMNTTQPNAN
ncbi:MAG: cytochrome c [Acidobacteriaceae bacterium]